MRALEEFCREILRAPGVPQWIRERAHQFVPDEPYEEGRPYVRENDADNEVYRYAATKIEHKDIP